MRVYEISKQFSLPNKQVLELLQAGGFEVASHMAALSPAAVQYLEAKLAPATKASTVPKSTPKPVANSGAKSVSQAVANPAPATLKATPKVVVSNTAAKVTSGNQVPAPAGNGGAAKDPISLNPAPVTSAPVVVPTPAVARRAIAVQPLVLGELADQLGVSATEVIMYLLRSGVACAKNQILPADLVAKVVLQFEGELIKAPTTKAIGSALTNQTKTIKKLNKSERRDPIIAVVGHVDHGKTTLLDFIRKTRVAAKEAGGITQHLGAYKIKTAHGQMAFLDTPGHEAFAAIRARGLAIADVVILVVAGDDGLKPQTIEAINYIKQVKATVVVAVNKMDKAAPERLESIRTQLAQYDLLPEEWGGDVIVLPISAKTGVGVDKLLEMVALQAELLELKADPELPSSGYVLEAQIKKGRGNVGTYIAQHGTLKVGDYFICGATRGCVTALIDEKGQNLKVVGPAEPVLVAGFEALPRAGDYFEVVVVADYKQAAMRVNAKVTAQLNTASSAQTVNLILKADTDSAREALCDAIDKLNKSKEPVVKLVAAGVGNISEKDITLAQAVGAVIYSFNSKVDPQARALAQQLQIQVHNYDIIYKLIDDLQVLIDSKKVVEVKRERIGTLIVRKVFNIKGVGVIAGFGVRDGFITNHSEVKVLRGRAYVAEGGLKSLQSDKQNVTKITTNHEGALMMKNFNDWLVDDVVEVYTTK